MKVDNRIAFLLILMVAGPLAGYFYYTGREIFKARAGIAEPIPQKPQPLYPPEPPPYPIRGQALMDFVKVKYCPIYGRTPDELSASVEAHRRKYNWTGLTAYNNRWIPGPQTDGRCGASQGQYMIEPYVVLPNWDPPPDATDEAKWWWDRHIRSVAKHEQHHVDDGNRIYVQAIPEIRMSTCESLEETFARVGKRVQEASDKYHASVGQRTDSVPLAWDGD